MPSLLAGLNPGAIADIIAAGVLRRFTSGQIIDLASLADVGYFSRLLNKWKRKGALVKTRSKVVILHPEGMLDAEPPH